MTASFADMTVDELRHAMAPEIARAAVFDGWTGDAVRAAAAGMAIDEDVAAFAFQGGATDMIGAWIASIDSAMVQTFSAENLAKLPIRERIRTLVQFRLDSVTGLEEALKRAHSIMAMPQNLTFAAKAAWHSADAMWRLAGDTATDYNHYTKRMILGSIYAATLAVFADDVSADKAETKAFLDRRIDGVMRFEKAKAKWLNPDRPHFSVTRFLGRLRYPAA